MEKPSTIHPIEEKKEPTYRELDRLDKIDTDRGMKSNLWFRITMAIDQGDLDKARAQVGDNPLALHELEQYIKAQENSPDRFRVIGARDGIPAEVLDEMQSSLKIANGIFEVSIGGKRVGGTVTSINGIAGPMFEGVEFRSIDDTSVSDAVRDGLVAKYAKTLTALVKGRHWTRKPSAEDGGQQIPESTRRMIEEQEEQGIYIK